MYVAGCLLRNKKKNPHARLRADSEEEDAAVNHESGGFFKKFTDYLRDHSP